MVSPEIEQMDQDVMAVCNGLRRKSIGLGCEGRCCTDAAQERGEACLTFLWIRKRG